MGGMPFTRVHTGQARDILALTLPVAHGRQAAAAVCDYLFLFAISFTIVSADCTVFVSTLPRAASTDCTTRSLRATPFRFDGRSRYAA